MTLNQVQRKFKNLAQRVAADDSFDIFQNWYCHQKNHMTVIWQLALHFPLAYHHFHWPARDIGKLHCG